MVNVFDKFKPLLSGKPDNETPEALIRDLQQLPYPIIASPKHDGIRIPIHPTLGPVSRTLKPIPNLYTRTFLTHMHFTCFDGEGIVGSPTDPKVFNRSTSGIMSQGGTPDFKYYVFDDFSNPDRPFVGRLDDLRARFEGMDKDFAGRVVLVEQRAIHSYDDLVEYENHCIAQGYEGIMLRSRMGKYKFGRSTFREGILIKLKRFEDAEATITGYEQLYENQNVLQRDAMGYAKRSSHQANLKPLPMIGTLICSNDEFKDFGIGTGFDDAWRSYWWEHRDQLIGKTVRFRFQRHGTIDAPRIASFQGFRHADDL